MFIILTPSGFEELHKHTFTMQNPLVDPAGQKPNTINPDLVK